MFAKIIFWKGFSQILLFYVDSFYFWSNNSWNIQVDAEQSMLEMQSTIYFKSKKELYNYTALG